MKHENLVVLRKIEALTLETSALLSTCGGNLILIYYDRLVGKETMVLCRWGSKILKFGIQQVKGQISNRGNITKVKVRAIALR